MGRKLQCLQLYVSTPMLCPPSCRRFRRTHLRLQWRLSQHYHSQVSPKILGNLHSNEKLGSRLNPASDDYGRQLFADRCQLKLYAGSGGHGCVSFLREKFIAEGPPNGGDGGSGGNIYIQATPGETSLHRLSRQGTVRAGRGRNGQGKSKGGPRGEDVLIRVPIGTVVKEISRIDPVAIEAASRKRKDSEIEGSQSQPSRSDRWILHPNTTSRDLENSRLLSPPNPRRSSMAALEPASPILLDLSKPMEEPKLLVAGAVGGLGNPHFVTQHVSRPKVATRGGHGMRLEVQLELKLLADLGFVGYPNVGKSTLLRSLSRSQARIGDWEFTTLQPNIGTVVLDDHCGPAKIHARYPDGRRRTQLSVADIPGIVADAHLDRGLGLGFLRHIERARVLAFVIDLSNADAVESLKTLWNELIQFERLKCRAEPTGMEADIIDWDEFGSSPPDKLVRDNFKASSRVMSTTPVDLGLLPISTKPWFVIATKSDLDGAQQNFERLRQYLKDVEDGSEPCPANGSMSRWDDTIVVVPVSAIHSQGVEAIPRIAVNLFSSSPV